MTQRSAGELLRAYYAALDAPHLEDLDSLFAPEVVWSFPGVTLTTGAQVRRSMERSLATGLVMEHAIGHLVEHGDVAIGELVATNRLGGQVFTVPGAVVCEAAQGQIVRLAAYPDAEAMRPFLAALTAAQQAGRAP